MQYKLKNKSTNEETLCSKVVVDGFEYYVSDEVIRDIRPFKGRWQIEKGSILNKLPNYLTDLSECKLVVACNNPSIDIGQVIDEYHISTIKSLTDETLEEAAIKLWEQSHPNPIEMALFGAKWQQERMYSEEEVLNIIIECSRWQLPQTDEDLSKIKEWFNQFKNK